MIYHFMFKL